MTEISSVFSAGDAVLENSLKQMNGLVPVASGTHFPFQPSSSFIAAGNQMSFRTMHYFPKGSSRTRILISSAYANAIENFNATGFPLKISAAIEPAPWDASKTYQIGDQVLYLATTSGGGSYVNNPYFVCAAINTGSPPKPNNANWTAGTRPKSFPVTVNGIQDASFATQVTPDSTTVAKALILSDYLPFVVPAGSWLAIYSWIPASGVQLGVIAGQSQSNFLAPNASGGVTVSDRTSTGQGSLVAAGSNQMRPAAIIGSPVIRTPTVAIIGDSIAEGKAGGASLSVSSIVSGGTGYNVGDVLSIDGAGATVGAKAAGSNFRMIVDAVSSGVITTLRTLDGGGYAATASQTGQVLPTGNQAVTGGSGSGAIVTVSVGSNCYDIGDNLGGQGYIERALNLAGIPYVSCSSSGDRANLWTTRSYTRLSAIALSGVSSLILALGRNDLTAGDGLSTIQTNLVAISNMIRGIGVRKVFVCTVTPETTSTTTVGQSSLADQVVTANDTVRQQLNSWLRGGSAPFDGIIDVSATIENSLTGKFNPIGGLSAAADGKHPGLSAIQLMVPSVSAIVPNLI